MIFDGWISLYQTQGMDYPLYIFQDARFAKNRSEGWEPQGLIILTPGHHLSIFSDSSEVLWSGKLKPRRNWLGWVYPKREMGWFAEGIEWKSWHAYFCYQPPLRATLQEIYDTP